MALFGSKDKERPAARPGAVANGAAPPAMAATSTPAKPSKASPEDAKKAAQQSQQMLLGVGQIMTVLMNAPQFKKTPLAAAQALVLPAVSTGQFVVALARPGSGHLAPIAVALWASVSDEVDRRLATELDKPFQIAESEWKSGAHPWLILLAGDRRAIAPMLAQVQKTTLGGREFKTRLTNAEGKSEVRTFSQSADPQPATG